MMKNLIESLDYHDMENQVNPKITVDEYAAKMGSDADIVTITFTVKSKLVADDLVSWFERGYDYVLDASVSDGEIAPGKWLVFVELERRSTVPSRICSLLEDLDTLTNLKLSEWTIEIEGNETSPDEESIRSEMILNPNEYKAFKDVADKEEDQELTEVKKLSGIEIPSTSVSQDEILKSFKAMAGL